MLCLPITQGKLVSPQLTRWSHEEDSIAYHELGLHLCLCALLSRLYCFFVPLYGVGEVGAVNAVLLEMCLALDMDNLCH